MSDHADRLRDILELTDCSRGQWEPLLDALVAERDALQAFKDEALQTDWIARAEAAEARVTELEAAINRALTSIGMEFYGGRRGQTAEILRAALAAPTKEDTDE